MFGSCFVMLSSFAIRRAGCFPFIVLPSCCHVVVKCFVSLPRGDVDWSVVCDCGITWS